MRAKLFLQAVSGEAQTHAQVRAQVQVSDLWGVFQVFGGSEGAQEHAHGKRGVYLHRMRQGFCLEIRFSPTFKDS